MARVPIARRRFLIVAVPAWGWGLCLALFSSGTVADESASVVRIESAPGGQPRSGSGFVVRIEGDRAYVITADHVITTVDDGDVVKVDPAPRLYFHDRPQQAIPARVIAREGGNPEGLALLLAKSGLPAGVTALSMAPGGGDDLAPPEAVTALGVPASLNTWAVIPGAFVGRKNRDLLFSGGVDDGSSGGPLLKGSSVVGLVMGVVGNFGLAVPASSLRLFLKSKGVAWEGAAPAVSAATPAISTIDTDEPQIQSKPSVPAAPKSGETFRDCPNCPEMVVIPADSFRMGSPETEQGRQSDEGPVHAVTFIKPFALGKNEVTFDQWDACVRDGGCSYKPEDRGWGRGQRPVIDVSWNDAQEYLQWLSKKAGKTYRLPSEAEWEYAARAKMTTARFWGDDPGDACRYANVLDERKRENGFSWEVAHPCNDHYFETAPVGSFEANAFGLKDMLGNAWEWIQDCWNDSYKGAPSDGSAWTKGDCSQHVLRGGSWNSEPDSVRVAIRSRGVTGVQGYYYLGFRPARTF